MWVLSTKRQFCPQYSSVAITALFKSCQQQIKVIFSAEGSSLKRRGGIDLCDSFGLHPDWFLFTQNPLCLPRGPAERWAFITFTWVRKPAWCLAMRLSSNDRAGPEQRRSEKISTDPVFQCLHSHLWLPHYIAAHLCAIYHSATKHFQLKVSGHATPI